MSCFSLPAGYCGTSKRVWCRNVDSQTLAGSENGQVTVLIPHMTRDTKTGSASRRLRDPFTSEVEPGMVASKV
jgi:hypothetical protein